MKYIAILLSLFMLFGCASFDTTGTKSALNLGKDTGDTVTASDFDAIDTAVTDNDTRLDTAEATLGTDFTDGSNLTDVDAATGDSATGFFDAGTIEHERGGLEADVSAYDGLIKVSGGATSEAVAGTDYLAPSGDAGTPSAIVLTNGTGLPISTGVTGLGDGVAAAAAETTNGADGIVVLDETGALPSADGSNLTGVNTTPDKIFEGDTLVEAVDTGSDGTVTIKVDNTTVWEADSGGISQGPIYINYAVDGTTLHSGKIGGVGLVSGENIDRGEICVLADDGAVDLFDANDVDSALKPDGICIANNTSGNPIYFLTEGTIYQAAHGITVNHPICASETAGAYEDCATTVAAWDTDGDIGIVIGKAISANVLYFNFSGEPKVHN